MSEKKQGIDKELIRELANILNDTDLSEIEVEQEDLRIRVSRAAPPTTVYAAAPTGYAAPAPAPAAAAVAAPAAPAVAAAPARNPANTVTSPMVGTVYLSPAPGARPFVEVGATVKEGQTILIVEAMKTMNQIPAPKSGKVVEIVVNDSQPVEYGEALVVIE
ncbi:MULTISPECIES: acetyl-CoA carboxylase biotin carboxyl carrier protein [Rhizobium/Agrobacterium group]|jgi:acetyl-CoA carboxylase biotin carboxyl carrier protein|uniref:Biotin carboxyl carrier protein of acetyl-CoA carboxylase n=2 Tax=Rhizobium/Agrobacterium group TaxID=227290 RepID=A0A1B9UKZ5_AGRTU|nr:MULTISPECIES: acetyl-CoA carboxylase biotin carboxyl carrier protein [Rhizobium/Agrobacterium group]AHK01194.1 biotin carboxyl carrier protein of acetyl-CoAcarboxylase [Agrobacterium tumefaciens LBA4213 (Ach5)]AKC07005.1 acetyl-CoA carboxylase, biotin carboxyl carrier protein [Agrobacterium tumefaciens]EHJ99662.1 acetyl-CoA carboxylase biotin carboxyl carrier protein subunit [Agrobacterium tumefaciens 5A]QDG92909.1 acetyl-CoA carboxylase biotin carboxyl carrier protein [Rhizobium sp. NIBRBAC